MDELEMCEECHGRGISDVCDECRQKEEEYEEEEFEAAQLGLTEHQRKQVQQIVKQIIG